MSDRVTLIVPAKGEYARTVRMAAGALVSRGGTIDDVEDVRIAVDEAHVFACEHLPEAAGVTYVFELDPAELRAEVGALPRAAAGDGEQETSTRYARFILESVCDSFDFDIRGDACYLVLVKRLAVGA